MFYGDACPQTRAFSVFVFLYCWLAFDSKYACNRGINMSQSALEVETVSSARTAFFGLLKFRVFYEKPFNKFEELATLDMHQFAFVI